MVMGSRCFVVFFSFMALWLVTGCNRSTAVETTPAAPSSTLPNASPTATASPANPADSNKMDEAAAAKLDEFFKVMGAATTARSFRAKVEAEVDGEKSGFDLDFVAPDRYRMKGQGFEFIIIGRTGYLKIEEKWQQAPRDEADQSNTFNVGNAPVFWGAAAVAKLKPLTRLKNISETQLDGQPAVLYEYEMTDALGHKGNNRSRTWVRRDGLPRRTEMNGEYDGVKSHAVMTWLVYGVSLKIEAPPVS